MKLFLGLTSKSAEVLLKWRTPNERVRKALILTVLCLAKPSSQHWQQLPCYSTVEEEEVPWDQELPPPTLGAIWTPAEQRSPSLGSLEGQHSSYPFYKYPDRPHFPSEEWADSSTQSVKCVRVSQLELEGTYRTLGGCAGSQKWLKPRWAEMLYQQVPTTSSYSLLRTLPRKVLGTLPTTLIPSEHLVFPKLPSCRVMMCLHDVKMSQIH